METHGDQAHIDWLQERCAAMVDRLNVMVRERESLDARIRRQRTHIDAVNTTLDAFRLERNPKDAVAFIMSVGKSNVERGQFEIPKGLSGYLARDGAVKLHIDGNTVKGRIQRYPSRGNVVRVIPETDLRAYFARLEGTTINVQIPDARNIKFASP